jgi:CotH kinase protein/FlgD Ig-like domain/Lamin Tail Domain
VHTRLKAQDSFLSVFQTRVIFLVFTLLLVANAPVRALEVDVSYSFPQVGEWVPPPWYLVEGAIIATFTGDEDMSPLPGSANLQQVDGSTWTLLFTWDWSEPVPVSFLGALGDTVQLVGAPQPVIPYGAKSHHLPTFHITTPRINLWDPARGIYVYGDSSNFLQHGVEWERGCLVEFHNSDDQSSFTEPVGLRINGGWSRRFDQKSFRLYFDDYGAADEIVHDLFDGGPTTFQRLILRTHRFPFNCFNSDVLEGIWLDQGHLGSRIQPAVAYVNNEYWGTYSLRERLDDEFLEVTHGIEAGTYIYIKDGIVEQGDPTDWANLIASFSQSQDFASHDWFVDISQKVDLPTYVDWLILNIFSASADNGFDANLAQLKEGDGPWKFIMWDEDDTFFPQNLDADLFRFFASEDQAAFEANWPPVFYYEGWDPTLQAWCNMFRGFMRNSEFKAFFFQRLEELLATELAPAALAARVDAIVLEQGGEMDLHAQRWNWDSAADFTTHADDLKSWSAARHVIMQDQAQSFFEEFRVPVELVAFEAIAQSDGIHLNWETRGEQGNTGFVVMREGIAGGEAQIIDSHVLNPDLLGPGNTDEPVYYTTVDTQPNNGNNNRYYLVWVDESSQEHSLPWIESAWNITWTGLELNEVMAENDTTIADGFGEFDDWLEFFNGTNVVVSLDSLYVTDDLAFPTRHRLAGGLQVEPFNHLVLWADGSPEQGPDHLNFDLSENGDAIHVFAPDGKTLLISFQFPRQIPDVSVARDPDGGNNWVYSAVPTPGSRNGDPETQSLLRFNEIAWVNDGIVADESGEFDPWLELYNPLPVPVTLDFLVLKFDGLVSDEWTFSGHKALPGYQLLWMDGQPEQGPFHSPHALTEEINSLELSITYSGEVIDSLSWQEPPLSGALLRCPDGSGPWLEGLEPTPWLPNPVPVPPSTLCINEFMALNGSIIADETGTFEDWVEIYNCGTETVSLGGMFLTDDLAAPTRWAFPDTTISAGEYLLVWCDSDPLDGPLHTNFKLSASGESVALYSSIADGNQLIDGYTFGAQTQDVSEGRGVGTDTVWVFFTDPSPGRTNDPLSSLTPAPRLTAGLLPNYPNPFNPSTTIVFALDKSADVQLDIHDVRGRLVTRLVQEWRTAGQHQVVWDGTDKQGEHVASGVYLLRLQAGSTRDSRRMLLLK